MTESRISPADRSFLLDLARSSIQSHIDGQGKASPHHVPDHLKVKMGAFVTLNLYGELRGRIGHIYPTMPLFVAVIENAIAAAFHDPRFPPLSRSELAEVDIEISVLSPLITVQFSSPQELLQVLRPKIDGVILEKGFARSTFLPQVWDDLPGKVEFLEHLSLKAGLPKDAWKDAKFQFYTVIHFSESEVRSQ